MTEFRFINILINQWCHCLIQIPPERCETIIGKAMDLHIKYGVAPVSPVTKTANVHNGKDSSASGRTAAVVPTS
jgi:hypothetical protein